jgi:hypothetical protein
MRAWRRTTRTGKHGHFTGQTIFGDSVVRVRAANLGVAVVRTW